MPIFPKAQRKKSTTLQRRLLVFFVCLSVFLVLTFALLLIVSDVTGNEKKALHSRMSAELADLNKTIADDFSRLSLEGIELAEAVAANCEEFFRKYSLDPSDLRSYPELLEPLLAEQAELLIHTVSSRSCGGVFILLDATVTEYDAGTRSGIFIKKTQPTSTQAVGVKLHYLRGPAQIARNNGIELLGQWRMEYSADDRLVFDQVMDTARSYSELPLSRLYYWTGRVTLQGNSEAGFLLCIPLRCRNGTVFGVCGIEVSDRLFKSLYSPDDSVYENVFAVAAPYGGGALHTSAGMIAGNSYLTGTRLTEDLTPVAHADGFVRFHADSGKFGGMSSTLQLYPNGSPYQSEQWAAAILMPETMLDAAIKSRTSWLFYVVAALLAVSLAASLLISRRYLRPVTDALDSIRSRSYEAHKPAPYLEINDLFAFLAQKDKEHEEALQQLNKEKQAVQTHYDRAQTWITHIADERMPEIDPDSYDLFLEHLHTLTPKEREIFDLYLAGKGTKEIMELTGINQNTLKYHNKNIYSKLGVASRKQLLEYAAIMQVENGRDRI